MLGQEMGVRMVSLPDYPAGAGGGEAGNLKAWGGF